MKKKKLSFVHLIGEGIGPDYAIALAILMQKIPNIEFDVTTIDEFRLPDGELNPDVVEIFKKIGLGIKGPTRTQEGTGPKSVNVALRQLLNLHANVRPARWFPGVDAPVKRPDLLDVVTFRENTEDVYMGIENPAGSEEVRSLLEFLHSEWNILPGTLPDAVETGVGIKIMSRPATEKIMKSALDFAIKKGRKRIGIAHKGNIMKFTEGAFLKWALDYAKKNYRDQVYCVGEEKDFDAAEKERRIFIDKVTADDAFAQLAIKPKRFDVIVTPNLNGDYISDLAAALVGGVPTAAGANIGDTCAIFEAVGGTADNIAGLDKANPAGFFSGFAMMLEHAELLEEANAIERAIAILFEQHIGTADMAFETDNPTIVSMTEFATKVGEIVEEKLLQMV